MFSLIIIIYTAVDCCTLILAELGTILFYLKKKKKILIFFIDFFSHDCMDVSEGRKALHHREARSIHERKLLSLSLRAGFHKHTHPHAHRLAQAHEQSSL